MAERKNTTAKRGKGNPPAKPLKRKMSKDPSKGEKLRCKVYDAVVKTLLKKRSGAFTLDEIAAQIGGSKGTIYYYFKSKGDVLFKLNLYFWGFIQESVISFIDNPGLTAREKLTMLIRNYITVSCEHWQLSCALWNDVALREVSAVQAGSINKGRKEYIRYITRLVKETIKEEKLEPVNPTVAALMIFSQIVYVSTWYKKGGDLSAEEIADYAVNMTFRGILSKNHKA
jgi:TetR/AcrR family transcriptional regulator, cholesterol catabolism regulator